MFEQELPEFITIFFYKLSAASSVLAPFWHKIMLAGQHQNSRGLFGNYHDRKKGNDHVLPEEWCKFIKKYGYLSSADTIYVEVND